MAAHGVGILLPFAAPWSGRFRPSALAPADGRIAALTRPRRHRCGIGDGSAWWDRAVPKRSELRISGRTVDALPPRDRDVVVWDRDLPGFGARTYSAARSAHLARDSVRESAEKIAVSIAADIL